MSTTVVSQNIRHLRFH